jgi:hypothetical protein
VERRSESTARKSREGPILPGDGTSQSQSIAARLNRKKAPRQERIIERDAGRGQEDRPPAVEVFSDTLDLSQREG